jgi:hypothetical protein
MSGIVRVAHSWVDSDTSDNALSTATKAAPAGGLSHFVTGVAGSYEAAAIGTLILKDGTTEVARWEAHNSFSEEFASPIKLSPATAANLELDASGSAGVDGTAVLKGFTK